MKRKGFRMKRDRLRSVRFAPYRKDAGPTFFLDMWDTHRVDRMGKTTIGYRLGECPKGKTKSKCKIIFEGEDFHTPHSADGNQTVRGLMSFLTLKPGDTDAEYFKDYTPAQRAFARNHAEALEMAVIDKFGED
jgi:hypothetical protein